MHHPRCLDPKSQTGEHPFPHEGGGCYLGIAEAGARHGCTCGAEPAGGEGPSAHPPTAREQGHLRWVRQEDAEGCAVAVIAMLTGGTYADVRAAIDGQDHHGHSGDWATDGVTHITIDRALVEHGYFMQVRYAAWCAAGEWPPKPWAPLHYAAVKQPSGNSHFVVMDSAGGVLDPMREGMFALTDWPAVNNVVGLARPEGC